MKYAEVMKTLKKLGTAQNVKVYRNHGAPDDLYGVSFADFEKLRKKIKCDHELALQLWDSGNTDARILAAMIADPAQMAPSLANSWIKDVSWYLLAGYFSSLMAKSPIALKKIDQWTSSQKEYYRAVGYDMFASLLKNNPESLADERCRDLLATIETEIHDSANRARYSMNIALIAIGTYKDNLTDVAIETAGRIGKVKVNHGTTACKTPDAADYIAKAVSRRGRKKAG